MMKGCDVASDNWHALKSVCRVSHRVQHYSVE